jgi:hypothetical protein
VKYLTSRKGLILSSASGCLGAAMKRVSLEPKAGL